MAENDSPLSDALGSNPNIGDSSEDADTGFADTGSWTEETAASVQTLLPLILPRLGGATAAMVLQSLRVAARRFCHDTEAWRETFEFLTVLGQTDYALIALFPYENVYIQRVVKVKIHGVEFWHDQYWIDGRTGVLKLRYASPQSGQSVVVVASIMPTPACDLYPQTFLDEFSEGIVAATLSDLKAERGRPYSDPDNVGLWEARYLRAVGIARRDTAESHKTAAAQRAGEFY